MRKHLSADPEFETIAKVGNTPPLAYEDEENDVFVPRLGSDDLLYIADFAQQEGFEVDRLIVTDRSGSRFASDVEDEISDHLLAALRGSGPKYTSALLATQYSGLTLVAVDLTSPDMHSLLLRRLGVVETDSVSTVNALLEAAWHRLRFS